MDLERIEGLVRIMEGSSLKTMRLRDGEFEISMSKLDNAPVLAAPGLPAYPGYSGAGSVPEERKESVAAGEEQEDTEFHITSPIVGTFYSAAGPDIPAYVKVGDRVQAGATVCILEAMKMMNEITADYDCEIEAVLVSNEQKVEYGQPLFRVKKL